MEREDVGVGELGGDGDLPQKPCGSDPDREIRLQDLERDPAMVLEIFGEEDDRHAAAPHFAFDAVAARQIDAEPVHDPRHVQGRRGRSQPPELIGDGVEASAVSVRREQRQDFAAERRILCRRVEVGHPPLGRVLERGGEQLVDAVPLIGGHGGERGQRTG